MAVSEGQKASGFLRFAVIIAAIGALVSAGTTGAVAAAAFRPLSTSASVPRPAQIVPKLTSTGGIARPPWWKGVCDDQHQHSPASYRLGASWDGLLACGPGPNEGGADSEVHFYSGAWGELEWECVELSMRWMYLAWGVTPYAANGDQVVDNYSSPADGPKLDVVQNGTVGVAPQPGDVLELTDPYDSFGHTEVVTSSSVDPQGNGSVEVITQNLDAPTNGWYQLGVSDWVVDGEFGTVVDWLHNPAWTLQEPLVYEVDNGELLLKDDAIQGAYVPIMSGVQSAQVIGGDGSEPEPLLVVLTTSGTLEAGAYWPGESAGNQPPLSEIASGVTAFGAGAREGSNGLTTIGWLTSAGDFYSLTGSVATARHVLEAKGATSIAVGSNPPASGPLLGYVTANHRAYVKAGTSAFGPVAIGVKTLVLAGDNTAGSDDLIGYIGTAGRAHVKIGQSGAFERIDPPGLSGSASLITSLSLATVGPSAAPLVAYTTAGGKGFVELGAGGFLEASADASDIVVAAADSATGFPMLAVQTSSGYWYMKEGTLSAPYHFEGSGSALGLGALVVS
jgi:hypothetical protein